MTQTTKIKYVDELVRATWRTLADIRQTFSESEIVEMCNRYQDGQKHARNYRLRNQAKISVMKDRLAEFEKREGA